MSVVLLRKQHSQVRRCIDALPLHVVDEALAALVVHLAHLSGRNAEAAALAEPLIKELRLQCGCHLAPLLRRRLAPPTSPASPAPALARQASVVQTEATPAAQTLEAMLLAMRVGLEEPGIVPSNGSTDDLSSLRRIALVALGGGESGGAGGETDDRLRHACAGVLAYRLRIAAETNGTPAPLSTLAAHALFAQLEREWPPGELSAALAAAEPAQRQGVVEEVGVALKVAPLLPPGQWHRPRPPQKPRTIDFSKVDLTFLGGYPALP